MQKPKHLIQLLIVLFLSFTTTLLPNSLNSAFQIAGKNKPELTAVINHYSKKSEDSLKLKAAVFLIENMDGHFSYQSNAWNEYCIQIDTLLKSKSKQQVFVEKQDSLNESFSDKLVEYRQIEDLKTIKAEFLIKNIDFAFIAWKSPYAQHLTFNQFCEYLFPTELEMKHWLIGGSITKKQ